MNHFVDQQKVIRAKDIAMKRKPRLIERPHKFNELSDAEKIEARLAWLEWKMVQVLWHIVRLTAFIGAAIITWLTSEAAGSRSPWLLVPMFVGCLALIGWWAQRSEFRGAPPHVDFIDP
jgi:hypothetical protein